MQQVGLDTAELSAANRQSINPPKPPRDRSKKRQTELIIHEATRKSSRRDRSNLERTEEEIKQDEAVRQHCRFTTQHNPGLTDPLCFGFGSD